MSKWEPRAGVSRRGNPYAGVGPWHVSGPRRDRGGSEFGAMVLIVLSILAGIGLVIVAWPLFLVLGILALIFVPIQRRRVREATIAMRVEKAAQRDREIAADPALKQRWEDSIRRAVAAGVPVHKLCEINYLTMEQLNEIVAAVPPVGAPRTKPVRETWR